MDIVAGVGPDMMGDERAGDGECAGDDSLDEGVDAGAKNRPLCDAGREDLGRAEGCGCSRA